MRGLRASGVTIILTTHYIDEAEEMADRIGVINKGELILVEEKAELMRKLGKKQLTLYLQAPLDDAAGGAVAVRPGTRPRAAMRSSTPTTRAPNAPASPGCWRRSAPPASASRTFRPSESSLEEIFVNLVSDRK